MLYQSCMVQKPRTLANGWAFARNNSFVRDGYFDYQLS